MIHITELESELLLEIACSDFSSDGYGFSWCYRSNMGYNTAWINQMRGCMTSLKAKGVISVSVDYDKWEGMNITWVGVSSDYIRDATDEEKAVKDSIAAYTGKCYANLDRRICRTPKPIYGQPVIGIENKENDEE
tara:strand:+ start:22 stop:426 length:405 start_codon:yes stop_codon:yes gene_type:complete